MGEDYGKYMAQPKAQPRTMNPIVAQYLEQARRMFMKYDKDGSGGIDQKELRSMMVDTYQTMGIDFQPTQMDINSYMSMVDVNRDGII